MKKGEERPPGQPAAQSEEEGGPSGPALRNPSARSPLPRREAAGPPTGMSHEKEVISGNGRPERWNREKAGTEGAWTPRRKGARGRGPQEAGEDRAAERGRLSTDMSSPCPSLESGVDAHVGGLARAGHTARLTLSAQHMLAVGIDHHRQQRPRASECGERGGPGSGPQSTSLPVSRGAVSDFPRTELGELGGWRGGRVKTAPHLLWTRPGPSPSPLQSTVTLGSGMRPPGSRPAPRVRMPHASQLGTRKALPGGD